MASHSYLLVLFSALCLTNCSADLIGQYCNGNTITSNTALSSNIDRLLSTVSQKIEKTPFIATSTGKGDSQAYVLAQCKGYATTTQCSTCVKNATKQIRQLCSDDSDARVWYEYCFLRYSQEDFFGKDDTSWGVLLANVQNVTDPDSFNKELGKVFDKLDSQAAKVDGPRFAEGTKELSPLTTLYAFAQCTKDLPQLDCAQCLAIAIQNFDGFCSDKKGCQVFYSTCYVRYEEYPFFSSSSESQSLTHLKIRKALIYP